MANKKEANKTKYDFVAVTACVTGVAHTTMSAESIEKFAKENNLKVKVERQGAQGALNPLSIEDVKDAKYVLLAIDRPIEGMDRFDGKKTLKTKTINTMKNMKKVYEELKQAQVLSVKGAKSSSSNKQQNNVQGNRPTKIMTAVMNGLSYMIPIVIVGGLFLAFSLGIGRLALGGDVTKPEHHGTIWYSIFQMGVVGIQLAVAVLAGFIASGLGGRMAMAPAMILAFAAQGIGMGDVNWTFFNYQTLQFGVEGSNLSFFGAVAAGLLVGYATFYWNKWISPKIGRSLKTVEPIIIVPILFVLVGWMLFAFILYLPLYWMAYGLSIAIKTLIDYNLIWIVGAIGGGMMCFDLGGPVNKIAFGVALSVIEPHPEVMGAIAAAGSVGPFGMAFGYLIGKNIFRIKAFQEDDLAKESFVPALFMGTLGISEGAIPYTIKYPKTAIIANVIGGIVAGALSGSFLITDSAAHTGPIVYFLGAVGRNGQTDYLYGLLYIMSIAIGSGVTAITFATSEWFFRRRKSIKEQLVK